MTPIQVLSQALRIDPKTTGLLFLGLAVFAAAILVSTWTSDPKTASIIGLYIAGLGSLLVLLAYIAQNEQQKLVLSWLFVFTIVACVIIFFISAVVRPNWLPA